MWGLRVLAGSDRVRGGYGLNCVLCIDSSWGWEYNYFSIGEQGEGFDGACYVFYG